MNRTFATITNNVGLMIGDSTSAMSSLIKSYINDRMAEVLKRTNILDVNRADYSFSTTSGTEDYILPSDFGKEIIVRDATNKVNLSRVDSQSNVMLNPYSTDDTGVVKQYVILDKTYQEQPSSASVISFVSSSASDTSQIMYVKGFDSNGYEDYEQKQINGTTTVSTTKSFSRIVSVSKSALTSGTITVTSNSGAKTIAVMSRAMLEYRVKVMRLVNIPNATLTIDVIYIPKMLPMVQDYDYPIIDCADILEAGATADAWRFKRQFSKAADMDIIFEKRLANLLFDTENQPNKLNLFRPQSYRYHESNSNVNDSRYGVF
jgi:hypothetical protein